MNKVKFILIALVIFFAAQTSANAQIKLITLHNGLTVIYKQNTSNQIVALDLFIKAGSSRETKEQAGITNFIHHLLLKGTPTRSAQELALEIESIGGVINADVADDYSEAYVIVTSEHFEKAMEILFDTVENPLFLQEEIEKERSLILSQIRSKEDSIFETAFDELNKTLYQDHPYSKPVIGTRETISSITREDIIAFHKDVYKPRNMVLVIVGDVKEKLLMSALKNIEKGWKSLPEGVDDEKQINKSEIFNELLPERGEALTKSIEGKFEQAYMMSAYLVPGISSSDYPPIKVMNALLGGGMSSRLFVNVRDRDALAYEVGSFYPSRKLTSKFVIYLGLDAKNMDKAQKSIEGELNRLKTEKVGEAELTEIKNYLKGVFLVEHQKNQKQAWHLGWYHVLGKGYSYDKTYVEALEKVTPEDILRVAQQYFKDENKVTIKILPEAR
ncbi:MAG: pitrilysin family protein [bacterium]